MADRLMRDLFVLGVLLIIVVYFTGSTSFLATAVQGIIGLDYAATGRTQKGQFANYPGVN